MTAGQDHGRVSRPCRTAFWRTLMRLLAAFLAARRALGEALGTSLVLACSTTLQASNTWNCSCLRRSGFSAIWRASRPAPSTESHSVSELAWSVVLVPPHV